MNIRFRPLLAAIIVVAAVTSSYAVTITVSPDGTGDYPTIQDALDAAVSWDEIVLTDGVFTGDGNRDLVYPALYLSIRSESGNPEACVIDLQAGPGNAHFGLKYGDGG